MIEREYQHLGASPFSEAPEITAAKQRALREGKPLQVADEATQAVVDVFPSHGRVDLESGQAFAYVPNAPSGERKDFFRTVYQHGGRSYTIAVHVVVKDCGSVQPNWVSEVGPANEVCVANGNK